MRILISGGGVSGLTCAYWLEQAGHTPLVVERGRAGPLGGYGIDFSGTAYAWAPLLRRGFGDTRSILRTPEATKEKEKEKTP